jgi:hypothetical protein
LSSGFIFVVPIPNVEQGASIGRLLRLDMKMGSFFVLLSKPRYPAAMPPSTPRPGPARDWPIPPMDHAAGHKDTAFTWAMGRMGRLTPKLYRT